MNPKMLITTAISVLIISLVFWDYFHGGVPSHHLLQRKDLPAISNWWGVILLPTLSWILLTKTEKRLQPKYGKQWLIKSIPLFFLGVIIALGIVTAFNAKYIALLSKIPYLFLVISFFIPIFYAEFMLGFILAMMYTFGVFIPTLFILVFGLLGFVIFRFVRPIFIRKTV